MPKKTKQALRFSSAQITDFPDLITEFPTVDETIYMQAASQLLHLLPNDWKIVPFARKVDHTDALGWLFEMPTASMLRRGGAAKPLEMIPDKFSEFDEQALLLREQFPVTVAGELRGKLFVVPLVPPSTQNYFGSGGATGAPSTATPDPSPEQLLSGAAQTVLRSIGGLVSALGNDLKAIEKTFRAGQPPTDQTKSK